MSHCIIVLGFHRSGTSLVTKSLECLGVSLGDRAKWSAPDNPSGFWEDLDILAINEEVLKRYGSAWDKPLNTKTPVILSDLRPIANRIIADRMTRFKPVFAFKDPRMCRLIQFWAPLIERWASKVSVVQVHRNPREICESLMKRNGGTMKQWLELEWDYMQTMGRDLINLGWPIMQVEYADMIKYPAMTVRDLGKSLDLPADEHKLDKFCNEFVRR